MVLVNLYTNNTPVVGSAFGNFFYDGYNHAGINYLEHNINFTTTNAVLSGVVLKVYFDSLISTHGGEDVYLEWQSSDMSLKYEPTYDREITGIAKNSTHTINIKVDVLAGTFVMGLDGANFQAAKAYTDNNNGYLSIAFGANLDNVTVNSYTVDGLATAGKHGRLVAYVY